MDAISFDRLVRSLATRPSRRRITRALSSLTLAGLVTQLPETPAGVAKKKKKVTLCHEGQTITVGRKKKKKLLKGGATPGQCLPPPPPPPPTTTTTTLPPGSCAGGEGSPCGTTNGVACLCVAQANDLDQIVCASLFGLDLDATCLSDEDCSDGKVCVLDINHETALCLSPCTA